MPYPAPRQPNFDSPGRDEPTLTENEFQTVGRKPRFVDRDQAIDQFAFALAHAGHVQSPGAKAQSEGRSMANELDNLGAVNHILTGQAGNVGT